MKTARRLLLLLLAAASTSSFAASLATSASASMSGTVCTGEDSCFGYSLNDAHSGSTHASAEVHSFFGYAAAEALAGFGSLSASASAAVYGGPPGEFPQAQNFPPSADAEASFEDTIFTFGPPGRGILHVNLDLVEEGELGNASIGLTEFRMGDILLPFSDLWTEFPLHGSIPMFARIHALGGDGRPNEDEGGLIGVVRFRILSFDLRDLDGNPIPNLPYRSESGTRYFGDQNYVPEPGTASLLLVSVGLLAGLGFVKHRTMGDQRAARMSG